MNSHRAGLFALLCALLMGCTMVTLAQAVTTSYWEVRSHEQFNKGTPENVSILSDGKVSLSPVLELLADTGEPFVWCLVQDSKGNLFAGTGNNGKIFKIDKNARLTLWHDSEELEILSLAASGLPPKARQTSFSQRNRSMYGLWPSMKAEIYTVVPAMRERSSR